MSSELPSCVVCKKKIQDLYVWTNKQKKAHKDCFKCANCNLPFPDGEYVLVDGAAFDQLCGEINILKKKNFKEYNYGPNTKDAEAADEMTTHC